MPENQNHTQSVEKAREQWKDHLGSVWCGMGSWIHSGAKYLQEAAGAAIIGSSPSLVIPIIGEALEGSEFLLYSFATAVKGAVRTSAENHAIKAAGGSENDEGGLGTFFGNTVKSAIPVFDV